MPSVQRGLNLMFLDDTHARVHGGLSLACAAAALERSVRLFFQGEAVAAASTSRCYADDMALREAGIPTIGDLFRELAELGVPMIACETGMHRCGVTVDTLRTGVETGGLVAFLGSKDTELAIV